jgi:drug/metabolite transporter (DMT)-like permease
MLLATLLWGFIGLFPRFVASVDVFSFAFYNKLFAALFLLVFSVFWLRKNPLKTRNPKSLFAAGFFTCLVAVSLVNAYRDTQISTATVLFYAGPIFASLLSLVFLGEKLSVRKISALLLAFCGVLAISGLSFSLSQGVLYALLAGVFYGFQIFFQRKIGKNGEEDSAVTSLWQNGVVAILLLPFALQNPVPSSNSLFLLAIDGVFCFGFSFILFNEALKRASAATVGSLAYLEVVFATLTALLFLGESPSPQTVLGGALVIAAAVLISKEK